MSTQAISPMSEELPSLSRDVFIGQVVKLSDQGLGVVKRDNAEQIYFARGVWPGDIARFQTANIAKSDNNRYIFADLIEIIAASPQRRPAPCPHFGLAENDCYGCPWMIAPYQDQWQAKLERLRYSLERIGLDPSSVQAGWPAPQEFAYRSRAQFKSDGVQIGYAGRHGQQMAPVDKCAILSPQLSAKFAALKASLPRSDWRPSGPEPWVFMDVNEETAVDAVILNRRQAFAQANHAQNQQMKLWLQKRLTGFDRSSIILELFAGSGNFTAALVESGFQQIIAVEVDRASIASLKSRDWPQVSVIQSDLYRPKARFSLQHFLPQVLIVNPPRAGLGKLTELARTQKSLRHIAYISCQIKSFCGNARRLAKHGFRLVEVQPIDQMPQTPHLEMLAWFERE